MAGYTIVNLKEVEDQAPKFGLAPNIEARFANQALGMEKAGFSYMRLAPDFRAPFGHKHHVQEELYVVVGGSGRIKIGEEVEELKRFDAVRLGAGTMRSIEAGPEGIEFLAFGAPPTGPEDAEMVQDWWTD